MPTKDLRVSRDWLSGKWVDVKANPDILLAISGEFKPPVASTVRKDGDDADDSTLKNEVNENEDETADVPAPASSIGNIEKISASEEDDQDDGHHVNDKSNDVGVQDMCCDDDQNVGNDENDDRREGESGNGDVETAAQANDTLDQTDVV